MKARKLYSLSLLVKAHRRKLIGVPIRRITRDLTVTISIPTFTALLEHYESMLKYQNTTPVIANTIKNSLFPSWVVDNLPLAQEQPINWKYIGKFPVGAWIQQQ